MRAASDQARRSIGSGGLNVQWVFDLMYAGERRLQEVPIATGHSLQWDGTRFVTGSGTARVVWADSYGRSMAPREVGDWFSPFGGELQVDCLIGGGVFTERIPQGRFVITNVPDVVEARMPWEGQIIHPGEAFTLELSDPLVRVQRNDFALPTAPRSTSAWSEVQSISELPVLRNVDDKVLPPLPYEGAREPILQAIFDAMDAWPHVDSAGYLTARPKAWPDPVGELVDVVAAPPSMTSRETHNRVAVTGRSADGKPLYSVREVTEGFLRTRNADGSPSPFGGSTYPYRADRLTTQQQVDDYADALLRRVARLRSVTREITVPFNPLIEVGDVHIFRGGHVRTQVVRHVGATTVLTVEVPDA